MANPQTVWGFLSDVLKKQGIATVLALIFLGMIYIGQIKPAAAERQAAAKERVKLLDAVTNSLQRNSTAMERMSQAVERLDRTLRDLEDCQIETQSHLKAFTRSVQGCHEEQSGKLNTIIEQTKP